MIGLLAALAVGADARLAITEAHDWLSRGFAARDLRAWDRVLHPQLRVWWKGRPRYDKTGYLALARRELAEFRDPVTTHIRALALEGIGPDVMAVTQETTCYRQADRAGALHDVCYDQRYSERWRKQGGTWRLIEIRYPGALSQTVDRRPMNDADFAREFP